MRASSEPLAAFPHFSVRTSDAFEASVGRVYPGARLTGAGPRHLFSKSNRRVLTQTSLAYARTSLDLQIEIPEIDTYGLLLAWSGHARASDARIGDLGIAKGRAFMASPGQSIRLSYGDPFEHLIYGIRPEFLKAKLRALTGKDVKAPPRFVSTVDLTAPAPTHLHRMIAFLMDQLADGDSGINPLTISECEQALVVSLLCSVDHDHTRWLNGRTGSPAAWQVRQAEEFIEANWNKPLTVETLADLTNVSVRSLFYAFNKVRGCSPMEFVRQVRLRRVRDVLLNPGPGDSVTTAAFACGFGNLGHFSSYYRREFGELPSATLQRSRRTAG